MAMVPYLVLTVVAVAAVAITPVADRLERFEVGVPFPETSTGYDVVEEAEDPYNAFAPLTHPGTFLLVAAGAASAWYRSRGYYGAWREEAGRDEVERDVEPVVPALVGDAVPASVAVVSFLVLSQVMAHSGQTELLAVGISEVAPGGVYAFLAGWVGLIGSFTTSSNTTANIVFAPLQQTIAEAEELREAAVIAGHHAGAAVGNAVSPANVVLGTGAAGIVGQEGRVLRKVLPYAAAATVAVGVGTALLA